jgi:anti-sigma regulatory factor (Ser/Thr protein kinase)
MTEVSGTRWPDSSTLPPLGALPTAPAAARAYVRTALAQWGMTGLSDTVELVVSELVANGVNASTDDEGRPLYLDGKMLMIRVALLTDGTRLIAEVWDQAPGMPVRVAAGQDDETGRGLSLVDTLTGSQWGWQHAPAGPGKCVWAEFSVPAAASLS